MKGITESSVMKYEFLQKFKDNRIMPNRDEWEIIYQCAADNDEIIRYDAAEVLIRNSEEDFKPPLSINAKRWTVSSCIFGEYIF